MSGWQADISDRSPHVAGAMQTTNPDALKHLLAGGLVCNCSAGNLNKFIDGLTADVRSRVEYDQEWRQSSLWFTARLAEAAK